MTTEYGKIVDIDGAFYADGKELASILDITKARVSQLTAEGFFLREETEEGQLYNLHDCVQAYWEKKISTESEEDKKIRRDRAKAEVKLKKAKADIEALRAAELQGKMHRSEDVQLFTQDLVDCVKTSLLSLPGRCAVEVSLCETAEKASLILRDNVKEILRELSEYDYDPERYEALVRKRENINQKETEDDE